MFDFVQDRRFRLWAYGVTAAALGVAAIYGLVSGDEVQAWLVLASAVLGLAMSHVPPAPEGDEPRRAAEDVG